MGTELIALSIGAALLVMLAAINTTLGRLASTLEKYRRDRWTADCGRWDEEDDELIESEGDHE